MYTEYKINSDINKEFAILTILLFFVFEYFYVGNIRSASK